jgi:hypothetical protein
LAVANVILVGHYRSRFNNSRTKRREKNDTTLSGNIANALGERSNCRNKNLVLARESRTGNTTQTLK